MRKGFTLIELIVVMGIFATVVGIASINLINTQKKSYLNAAVQAFTADLKSQQMRAMVGEEDGTGSAANYGIHFEPDSYTQFRGNYGTNNFVANLPNNIQFENPPQEIIFEKGSGEIENPVTIVLKDSNGSNQKTININKYGVVTEAN